MNNNDYKNIKYVIIIQKYVRLYLIKKLILIPPAYYQTKNWRKNRKWYKNGKFNECEKYQINLIEKIINIKLLKTDDRINFESINIFNKKNPMRMEDGYEWSENFDGLVIKNNNKFYFNLKFVCDAGGAQTRSLKDVYNFIKYQLKYLIAQNSSTIHFINILDGECCYYNMNKFYFLIKNKIYKNVLKYIFIGSLHEFQKNKIIFNFK